METLCRPSLRYISVLRTNLLTDKLNALPNQTFSILCGMYCRHLAFLCCVIIHMIKKLVHRCFSWNLLQGLIQSVPICLNKSHRCWATFITFQGGEWKEWTMICHGLTPQDVLTMGGQLSLHWCWIAIYHVEALKIATSYSGSWSPLANGILKRLPKKGPILKFL